LRHISLLTAQNPARVAFSGHLGVRSAVRVLEESPFCGGTNSLLVQLPSSGTSSRRQHVDIATRRQS